MKKMLHQNKTYRANAIYNLLSKIERQNLKVNISNICYLYVLFFQKLKN